MAKTRAAAGRVRSGPSALGRSTRVAVSVNPVSDIPGLSALWQEASGGDPEIRIAIIDGPVDLGHPSLAGARLTFGGSTQGATASSVRSEHGTHVASVLMAQPGGPVLGIAPNATARLYSIYQEGEDGELLP